MRVVMAWHLSIRGADRWGASAGGLRPLAAPLVPPVRVLTSWLLLSLHTSLLTGAREHQLPERLIGWKGETHSVVNTVSEAVREDRRKGCEGVDAGGLDNLQQSPQHTWLYRYPSVEDGGPRYTHMAMITQLPNGTLLAAWQAAKTTEGTSDQHLVTCSSLDEEGRQWALPQRLAAVGDGKHPLWGPTFLVDKQRGTLWLFYSQNSGACKGGPMDWAPGGDIKGIRYNLNLQEWGTPQLILSIDGDGGIPKVTANKAIELSTGEFVLPFWREKSLIGTTKECKQLAGKESAGVLLSEDRGATWKPHGFLVAKGSWLIENAVVELNDNRLMMVFRTRVQKIYVSYSADKGRTWSPAKPLADFKNPNSKVDLVKLQPGGELALVYNDHKNPRVVVANLEDAVAKTLRIHYPTMQQAGCDLLVLYSQFHKLIERDDPRFAEQGIKLSRISLKTQAGSHYDIL